VNYFDLPRLFVLPFLFIFGLCIGSFLNVCIHRFPSKLRLLDQLKSLTSHGSGCPRCAASIKWHDNIPLLGWILLRGKCRNCRRSISVRYPLIELLTAVLFVVVYQIEMPPQNFWGPVTGAGLFDTDGPQNITTMASFPVWLHVRYLLHILMICCLIVATFIDFELRIIPDGCTVPMMLFSILFSTASGQAFIVPLWFQDASVAKTLRSISPDWLRPALFSWDCMPFVAEHPHIHGFLVSIAGLLVGGGIVWMVRIAGFWVLKQEAMGFGDVVLMAMIGSVIGWQPVIAVFFLAPVLAIFAAILAWITKRDREIPYGPWLSLATLLLILFWPIVWPLADRIFDMGPFVPLMGLSMFVSLLVSLQAIQLVKRLFGISSKTAAGLGDEGWSSADHLSYYNSERPDEQTGLWDRSVWPGGRSGRGLGNYYQWRHGRRD
jgi:leader peptidase (prepilin peptidase) / N-methyltransferase